MNKILRTFLILAFALILCYSANAQTDEPVQITQETAQICRDCLTERTALRREIETKTKAIEDLKAEINNLRVELARISGELSGEKQASVQSRAIIEILLKNVKKKKIGLINIF